MKTPKCVDEAIEWILLAKTTQKQIDRVNAVQERLAEANPVKHPMANPQWVDIQQVTPNDYNPNSVASRELQLLHLSISKDGFTQPVVGSKAPSGMVEIVDGFHRYFTTKHNPDILDSTHGRLPVVTISTQLGDRMEATVRHNRARGRHSVAGMAGMVFQLLEEGYTEDEVMDRLGMEAAEVARLKHITGFAKLLEDHEYTNALVSKRQILMAKEAGEKVL